MRSNDISGVWWLREYVVTRRFKELAESIHLTGCDFWPVIKHGKNEPFEDIFQLKITGEMPVMASETTIQYDPLSNERFHCPFGCGSANVEGKVYYYASDLVNVPDFALTKEWLGANFEFWRWPFMSHKVYKLFLENNIKGVRFYLPVIK